MFGGALRGLVARQGPMMLANRGSVQAGKDLEAAVHAMEELKNTEKLALLLRGMPAPALMQEQVTRFNVEWD